MKALIIDNYDSFTFNLYQLIASVCGDVPLVFRNDKISLAQIKEIDPTHIVLSPGPGHPANDSDFGVCADVIRNAATLAAGILGVCLGHQGIVHYSGGEVVRAPRPVHGKTSNIKVTGDSPLLAGIGNQFTAMRYHSLVAKDASLPATLDVTASTDDGLIMAISHKSLRMHGVQFHPESIGTSCGRKIMENFFALC